MLESGQPALEAVKAAVLVMEDVPEFNAGAGSVFAADGSIEMDAGLMEGARGAVGGVAAVKRHHHFILYLLSV